MLASISQIKQYIFIATDNTDISEDTKDGKSTTYGTITAVYQKANVSGEQIAPNQKTCEVQDLLVLSMCY